MKKIYTLAFILLSYLVTAQTGKQHYQRTTIFFDGKSVQELSSLGIDVLEGNHKKNYSFTTDLSDAELQRVKNANFKVHIDIEDVALYYQNQNANSEKIAANCPGIGSQPNTPTFNTPTNFSLGSMGGYFTYAEMLANLDSMASKYPNLITVKRGIPGGVTIEGDSILFVKISDNPTIDETEPEALYTALHHAREPGGLSNLIFYMWYLLENYSSNTNIQSLVNNTELYFVPCINPDGYKYNELTDPAGGGLWRKNRRDNLDGTFGIDLNRNYGKNWGYDNNGSSPITSSELYRGIGPFSEPETQLMSSFVSAHDFKMALNYHTYGNLLIYPWGYIAGFYTPDSARYTTYGQVLTRYNNYLAGTANQTVGYVVNGSSDDWMYGEQTIKPKVFALTPEAGDANFGFWPPSSEIIPICKNNVYNNLLNAKLAGKYAVVKPINSNPITSLNYQFKYDLTNVGTDSIANFTISIIPVSSNITSVGTAKTYTNPQPLTVVLDSIFLQLNNSISNGDLVKFVLLNDNGIYTQGDTITLTYSVNQPLVNIDLCNNLNNWTSTNSWNITTEAFTSSATSITDSPFSIYSPNEYSVITYDNNIDLTNAISAKIIYNAKWNIETGYDLVTPQVSLDQGLNWISACGLYTTLGNANQLLNEPIYDGSKQWVAEEIDLADYIGLTLKFRFLLISDNIFEEDGFYFDDFGVSINQAVGISENNLTNIKINPNPADEKIVIEIGDTKASSLSIYSVEGKLMLTQIIQPNKSRIELNTTSFDSGIYLIQFANESGIISSKRFVVKH